MKLNLVILFVSSSMAVTGCASMGNFLEETAELGTAVLTGYAGHLEEKNTQYRRSTEPLPTTSENSDDNSVKSRWDDKELSPCEKFVLERPNATACPA